MYGSQLSAFAAPVPLVLLPYKFIQTICLNQSEVFQHTHVIFCAIPFVQGLQPFAGVFGTFKTEHLFVFTFLNSAILAGLSFAAMSASMAGKSLALVRLAQSTVHPARRHKLPVHPSPP